MNCRRCRHDNEPNARFCSECGATLGLRCPECDAEQAAGSKFCNQCGSSLAVTPAVPAASPAAPTVNSAVRKQVTALFADLVGSTAFGERVDPEAARTALAPYFEVLKSTIEDHAGTVVKFTGDGVMAMFGVPEVAEDDALRAVAAGRELQRRFHAFAERVREQHGVGLGLRVGINTGELVIGDGDADMVGDVLNTAARLESACSPGHVLVGEDTWRLTRSMVAYEVLGEVRVKGKADALATFQVSGDGLHYIRRNPTLAYSVDPGEYLPFFHPDIEYLEHRKLSFEGGGVAELASATSTMDLVDHLVIPIIHRLSEVAVLYEQHLFDVDGNTSSVLALATWLDGLVRTFEAFDLDDFEHALARYDELVSASSPAGTGGTPANRATRLTELLTTAGASGDRSRFADLLSELVAQAGTSTVTSSYRTGRRRRDS